MHCHLCNQEAVDRCYTCGELFCADHGRVNCRSCETGIAAGDGREERVSARPLAKAGRPGWWRPQPAEDFEPPACHQCKGLARRVCMDCQGLYCPDHAGKNGRCSLCEKNTRSGTLFLAIFFTIFAAVLALAFWYSYGQ